MKLKLCPHIHLVMYVDYKKKNAIKCNLKYVLLCLFFADLVSYRAGSYVYYESVVLG